MHDALFVHSVNTLRYLLDYVLCTAFIHPLLLIELAQAVFKKVAASLKPGHEESLTVQVESLDQSYNVRLAVKQVNGCIFRHSVKLAFSLVLLLRHHFDCNFDACDAMVTELDCISGLDIDNAFHFVLVKLARESLSSQDGLETVVALSFAFEVNRARFIVFVCKAQNEKCWNVDLLIGHDSPTNN